MGGGVLYAAAAHDLRDLHFLSEELLASFLVKLSHTLDRFCLSTMVLLALLIDSRASVTSLFCKARERKASIRESLSIKANDVDGLNQLEPVLDSHP